MKRLILATALLATELTAAAAEALPPVVSKLADSKQVEIIKTFAAPMGLTGWAVSVNGLPSLFYTDQAGEHAFFGVLVDSSGRNLTEKYMEEHAQSSAYKDALTTLEKDAAWFEEGTGKQVIYAFYEPNCGYCAKLYDMTRPELANLRIRWVPVAFLAAESKDQAAAMLASKEPAKTLAAIHQARKTKSAPDLPSFTEKDSARVTANGAIMRQLGITGTPAIMYERDGKPTLVKGLPSPHDFALMAGKAK